MDPQPLRILSAEDVRRALPMAEAIEVMREAFAQLSSGEAQAPVRLNLEMAAERGRALFLSLIHI